MGWFCYECYLEGPEPIPTQEHREHRCQYDRTNGPFRQFIDTSKLRDQQRSSFTKHDKGKPRMDLLPPRATELEAECLGFGAKKYGDNNWKLCKEPARYIAAALRHIFARMRGERLDPESKIPHTVHAVCCLKFLCELDLREQTEERPLDEWKCLPNCILNAPHPERSCILGAKDK